MEKKKKSEAIFLRIDQDSRNAIGREIYRMKKEGYEISEQEVFRKIIREWVAKQKN